MYALFLVTGAIEFKPLGKSKGDTIVINEFFREHFNEIAERKAQEAVARCIKSHPTPPTQVNVNFYMLQRVTDWKPVSS